MINLIKCDFYKIKKEKAHIILLIVMIALMIFSYLMMFAFGKVLESLDTGDLYDGIQNLDPNTFLKQTNFLTHTQLLGGLLGLIAVLSISINIGNDFKNRTINLKILSGHSRSKICFAILMTNYILFMIYFIICMLVSLCSGYLLGGFGVSFADIMINSLLMLIHYFAVVAVSIFISLSLKSTLGIVLNMVVLIGISQFLGMAAVYLAEQSKIFRYFTEIIPYTALLNLSLGASKFNAFYILRNVLGALVFLALGLTGSFLVFRKKELH